MIDISEIEDVKTIFDDIITLGTCCEVNYVVRMMLDYHVAYPFDWSSCHDSDVVIKVIENDFADFLENETENQKIVHLLKYNISYCHGFDQNAIKRRIDRFREKVYSSSKKLLFIMKCHLDDVEYPLAKNLHLRDAFKLRNLIQILKKDDNFILLIVNESKEPKEPFIDGNLIMENIIGDTLYDNAKFIVNCNFPQHLGYAQHWKDIFIRLKEYLKSY